MQRQTSFRRLWGLAFFLCTAVFLFSGAMLLQDLRRSSQEHQANQLLAEQVSSAGCTALWEQNNDMAGWLSIAGTPLNYPVMFTPNEPEYYLRRGFDGQEALSGSLFIGEGCTPDGNHVIIYGHHMKDGSMFGSLPSYANMSYWQQHPVITFNTLKEPGEYEILAAFYSRIYAPEESGVFCYYQFTDLSDPEQFSNYIQQAKDSALYDTGVEAMYGQRILTLSTCSYHTEDGRFVVVARQKAAEEP